MAKRTGYEFRLGGVLLPITPKSAKYKITNRNKTLVLIDQGEINILKDPGLEEIEFDAMIPNARYPYGMYDSGFRDAGYYIEEFSKMKAGKEPKRFTVLREMPDGKRLVSTDINVSLEEYEIEEAQEHGFDFMIHLVLKQFRDHSTKIVKLSQDTSGAASASVENTRAAYTSPEPKESPIVYTVVAGDSLWGIAKKFYNDGSKYTKIYEANRSAIGENPNLIRAGLSLTIPVL